jgi:hypothetical protein
MRNTRLGSEDPSFCLVQETAKMQIIAQNKLIFISRLLGANEAIQEKLSVIGQGIVNCSI